MFFCSPRPPRRTRDSSLPGHGISIKIVPGALGASWASCGRVESFIFRFRRPPGAILGPSRRQFGTQEAAGGQKDTSGVDLGTFLASKNDDVWTRCLCLACCSLRDGFLHISDTPLLSIYCPLRCPRKTRECLATHKNLLFFMIFDVCCFAGRVPGKQKEAENQSQNLVQKNS